MDGVSAWGAIAHGEPSKRNEIVHDLWYQGNPDPDKRHGLKPHWAALHLDGMKLLIGSGATSWQLYNITDDPTGMQIGPGRRYNLSGRSILLFKL